MTAETPQNSPENSAYSNNSPALEHPTAPTSQIESSKASTLTPSTPATSSKPIKRRQPIDDALRRKIRRQSQDHPGLQAQLRQWAQNECGRDLTQGQISTILSPTYDYLDTDDRKDKHLTIQQHLKSDWPDLEAALFEWHQKLQNKRL